MGSQESQVSDIAGVLVKVVVVLIAGPLLVLWAIVKRPVLALAIAAFVGLVVLVGMHDAQALLGVAAAGPGGVAAGAQALV